MSLIICADQNLSNLDLYERVLSEKGFAVRTCNSGSDLIIEIESNPECLVILDLGLPCSTEISYCRMIKQRHGDEIPVIVIAEAEDEDSIVSSLNDGADDYLVKPLRLDDLVSKTSIFIAKSKSHTESHKQDQEPELFAGSYEILQEISSGSHSAVYHAIDKTKEEPLYVALKIFDLESYKEMESKMQSFLLREAYEMSKLNHPNIVRLYDFGKFGKTYYLVMEYVSGDNLEQVVAATGPLGEDDLTFIAYQSSLVIEYLEQHNLIHRDIKPGNLLLNKEGDIKFADFGLAKHVDDNSLSKNDEHFMGTPQYVAPEQIIPNSAIDIRCDVYSLGATLYFIGTNTTPFSGRNVVEILMNNVNSTPPPMHEINPLISSDLSMLVAKMMDKNRENRYMPSELKQMVTAMLEALE